MCQTRARSAPARVDPLWWGRKKTPAKGAAGPTEYDDDDEKPEVEVVTAGVSGVKVGDKNGVSAAPFNFNQAGGVRSRL